MYRNISSVFPQSKKGNEMTRRSIITMISVVTLAASALVLVARGGKVASDGEVIRAEVHGMLHFQEGQGYFISVKSREHRDWENRVWLWISENKVVVRKLQGLMDRNVTVKGELEQMPENIRASVPPHGMYLSHIEEIQEAK